MKNAKEKELARREHLIRCVVMLVFVFLAAIVAVGVYYTRPIQINVVTTAFNASSEQTFNVSSDSSKSKEEETVAIIISSQLESDAEEVLVEKSINLNTAGTEELERLPGIGPVLAGRIIQYREENGSFLEIEELKEVGGIGEKIFMKISDFVYVE